MIGLMVAIKMQMSNAPEAMRQNDVVVVVVGKPCRIMAVVSAEGPIYHTPWVKGLANFNVAQADLRGCLRKIPPLPFSAKGSRVKLQNCL